MQLMNPSGPAQSIRFIYFEYFSSFIIIIFTLNDVIRTVNEFNIYPKTGQTVTLSMLSTIKVYVKEQRPGN